MKLKKLFILLIILPTLLCGCFGNSNKEEEVNPNFGGSISLFAYAPDQLNPLTTKYHTNTSVLSVMYNSLVKLSPGLNITPEVAQSWSFSEDGKTCTFNLAPNVLFHDGSVLTATDIVYSLNQIKSNPHGMYHSIFKYIDNYSAKSELELTINLKEPGSTFLNGMDFPILKKDSPLTGSGPYKLTNSNDDYLVLTANTEPTALIKPNIAEIIIKLYPREDMEQSAFLSSDTNVFSSDFYQLAQLSSKTNVNKTEYLSDYFTFLGFNTESNFFSQPEARRAVASIIDKNELTNTVMVNYAVSCNTPYKPGTIYGGLYADDYGYSLDYAKAHLQNAEISPENTSFSVLVNEESAGKIKTAQYIVEKLKALNISATVRKLPFDQYMAELEEGNFTCFIGEITMDQMYDLRFLLNSEKNYFNYDNEYLDSVLNKFAYETNPDEKKKISQEIQNILQTDLPMISLYYRINVLFTDAKITGDYSPLQRNIYNNIENWIAK